MAGSGRQRNPTARPPARDGVAVVDKATGWTSHDVVAKARGRLSTRKVGHAGTLDPDATGVLVLGVGRATRLLRYVGDADKRYAGTLVLGAATSTLDASGDVTATFDMDHVGLEDVRRAAEGFVGEILQVPPMVSALKHGGRRLHELAREGIEVERAARPVTVHELSVEPTAERGRFRLELRCSSGTYVRSLADDLGRALGGGAHLAALRRTAIGAFTLTDAVPVEQLDPEHVRPPATMVGHLSTVTVDAEMAIAVGHGKVLPREALGVAGDAPWAVCDEAGGLLAVYEPHRDATAKPTVVLATP